MKTYREILVKMFKILKDLGVKAEEITLCTKRGIFMHSMWIEVVYKEDIEKETMDALSLFTVAWKVFPKKEEKAFKEFKDEVKSVFREVFGKELKERVVRRRY